MDLRFTAEELAFRDEVRAFFRSALPESIRDKLIANKGLAKDDIVTWQRILNAKGWAVANWPAEWGGTGWTPVQQYIFGEELQMTPAPQPLGFGVTMVGPVMIAFGSEEQKQRFLPRIANLDDWWCQGFSEPGAGSDLASLRTSAKRDGDHYVVNGQKTWTTLAQHADWIFCLVRTDPAAKKRQEGISFLLIDMTTPGITVRPIVSIDGSHHLNEVFFDDVRVPAENLVGEQALDRIAQQRCSSVRSKSIRAPVRPWSGCSSGSRWSRHRSRRRAQTGSSWSPRSPRRGRARARC